MLACLITTLLALPQGAAPGAPAAAKAQIPEDLKKAASAVTDAKGYAFELVVETSGGGGGFGGGGGRRGEGGGAGGAPPAGAPPGGGGAPPAGGAGAGGGGRGGFGGPQTFTGKFEKGKPAAITREDQTLYKLNDQIVYSRDGAWELFAMPQGGGPGGGRRAEGGGGAPGGAPPGGAGAPPAGGAPAGGAAGGGAGGPPGGRGGDFRRMGSIMTVQGLTLPHEVLASLDAAMTEVKREEKDGKVVWSGPLTQDLANKLSNVARWKEMAARFGGSAGDLNASGTLSITTTKEGAIESLHVETKISGGMGGDQSRKVDVKLSGVGATTVDVPKEALAKFSA